MLKKKTQKEFIEDCIKAHGNRYNYSKAVYDGSTKKVTIICKTHGEFRQTANNHCRGQGCPLCHPNWGTTLKDFITKARKIHGTTYSYKNTVYKNSQEKVEIICKKHGKFLQIPNSHLNGNGCPSCCAELRKSRGIDEPTGWSLDNWVKSANRSKNFESFKLYIIKIYSNDEEFFKIGRTFRSVKSRFYSLPYNYDIVKIIKSTNPKRIYNKERELKLLNKNNKYKPLKKFNGMYECFKNINY